MNLEIEKLDLEELQKVLDEPVLVYDIEMDEVGPKVLKYLSGTYNKVTDNKNQKVRTYRLISSDYCSDLPAEIKKLKGNGFHSKTIFFPEKFSDVYTSKLIAQYKMPFMSHWKVLEKVYYDEISNDQSYFSTFIVCVNMNTGEIKAMPMGKYSIYDENARKNLEFVGYKYITNNSLNQKVNELARTLKIY